MRSWLPLLLTLGPACQEYKFHPGPQAEDSGGKPLPEDPGPAGVLPPFDLPHDSGSRPCDLESVPAGTYLGAPTCTDLPQVGWDLVLERIVAAADLVDQRAAFGLPIVAPADDGRARVFAPVSWSDSYDCAEGALLVYDAETGVVQALQDGASNYIDGLSAFRGSSPQDRALRVDVTNADCSLDTILDVAADTWIRASGRSEHWSTTVRDLWHDGQPEIVTPQHAFSMAGEEFAFYTDERWTAVPTAADWDGDGWDEIFNAGGIMGGISGTRTSWDGLADLGITSRVFMGGLAWDGSAALFVGQDGASVFTADREGRVLWTAPPFDGDGSSSSDDPMALGDMDGDGLPEICAEDDASTVARHLDGTLLWERATQDYSLSTSGHACSLADLDADGRYEAVVWSNLGLWILDGATGEIRAHWDQGITALRFNGAAIADVDGDGSAEIVVTGTRAGRESLLNSRLFILGPATGRWARTRPVWNQTAYDVTAVRDDGTVPAFPFPNHETYNSWRAQPAHDGDHPDLEIEALETCRDDEHGVMAVQAVVHNRGSQDAPAGAVVRLFTWDAAIGGPLTEVASQILDEPIPSMTTSAGVVFRVTTAEWATRQVIQVDGAHPDECDRVNDRVDVWEE